MQHCTLTLQFAPADDESLLPLLQLQQSSSGMSEPVQQVQSARAQCAASHRRSQSCCSQLAAACSMLPLLLPDCGASLQRARARTTATAAAAAAAVVARERYACCLLLAAAELEHQAGRPNWMDGWMGHAARSRCTCH